MRLPAVCPTRENSAPLQNSVAGHLIKSSPGDHRYRGSARHDVCYTASEARAPPAPFRGSHDDQINHFDLSHLDYGVNRVSYYHQHAAVCVVGVREPSRKLPLAFLTQFIIGGLKSRLIDEGCRQVIKPA
jgi:hypothetical protein